MQTILILQTISFKSVYVVELLKNNARLNAIIRRFHDMVQKFWMKNNFHFVEMMSLPQIIRVKMVCIYRSYNESDFSDELSASLSLILKT